MYLMDSNFVIVDSIKCTNGISTDGHDFIHLSNGSYHLVGTEERVMDLSSFQTDNGTPGNTAATVIGNVIQRFDAQQNLEFEWKSLDHFAVNDCYSYYFTHPDILDHSHYNSLEVDQDGNYILSFRHLNEITKVDSSSGQIIWRLGGKNNQFTFLGDTTKFTAQHDARRISNGHLTLFDNASFSNGLPARALEYQLDETNMTATKVWEFTEPNNLSSQFIGNAHRLPNGNTLIDWGGAFPLSQSTSFTEVTQTGNIALALDFQSDRYVSYRAVKYELPFDLNRPTIDCNSANKTLSAPSGYQFYEWSTGDTTQTINISNPGDYQVWVNYGVGFISSRIFQVSDVSNPCASISLQENPPVQLKLFPNPISDFLNIHYSNSEVVPIKIFNTQGELVLQQTLKFSPTSSELRLNLSHLPQGLYLVHFREKTYRILKHY